VQDCTCLQQSRLRRATWHIQCYGTALHFNPMGRLFVMRRKFLHAISIVSLLALLVAQWLQRLIDWLNRRWVTLQCYQQYRRNNRQCRATDAAASPVEHPITLRRIRRASAAAGGSQSVNMTDANEFQPNTLTVTRGTTVTWANTGQSPHTVTDDPSKAANSSDSLLPAGAEPWDSGIVAGGGNFSHIDTPGHYVYFCIPHESLGMVGRITVSG